MRVFFASSSRRGWGLALAALLLCCTGLLQAQSDDNQGADNQAVDNPTSAGDPPAQVARLSYLSGDVGYFPLVSAIGATPRSIGH